MSTTHSQRKDDAAAIAFRKKKMNTMRLTAKQKEVIKLMQSREGKYVLSAHDADFYFNGKRLRYTTADDLRAKKLIVAVPREEGKRFGPRYFTLTDLGRSIEL